MAGGELLNLLSAQKSEYAALVRRTDGAEGHSWGPGVTLWGTTAAEYWGRVYLPETRREEGGWW